MWSSVETIKCTTPLPSKEAGPRPENQLKEAIWNPTCLHKDQSHKVNLRIVYDNLLSLLCLLTAGSLCPVPWVQAEKHNEFLDLPGKHWDDPAPFPVLVGQSQIAESKMPACPLLTVANESGPQIHSDTFKHVKESISEKFSLYCLLSVKTRALKTWKESIQGWCSEILFY